MCTSTPMPQRPTVALQHQQQQEASQAVCVAGLFAQPQMPERAGVLWLSSRLDCPAQQQN
jgi:hypothetical protein